MKFKKFKADINESHPDVKNAKSADDLKKLGWFDHFSELEADAAYKEVFEATRPKKVDAAPLQPALEDGKK